MANHMECAKCYENMPTVQALLDHIAANHPSVCTEVGCGMDREVVLEMIREGPGSPNYAWGKSLAGSAPFYGGCRPCHDAIITEVSRLERVAS